MRRFQARLTNGIIRVDSPVTSIEKQTKADANQQQDLLYMDLVETSKIKNECFDSYHLCSIPNSRGSSSSSGLPLDNMNLNDLKESSSKYVNRAASKSSFCFVTSQK